MVEVVSYIFGLGVPLARSNFERALILGTHDAMGGRQHDFGMNERPSALVHVELLCITLNNLLPQHGNHPGELSELSFIFFVSCYPEPDAVFVVHTATFQLVGWRGWGNGINGFVRGVAASLQVAFALSFKPERKEFVVILCWLKRSD